MSIKCDGCERVVSTPEWLTYFRPDALQETFGLCGCCVAGIRAGTEPGSVVLAPAEVAQLIEHMVEIAHGPFARAEIDSHSRAALAALKSKVRG